MLNQQQQQSIQQQQYQQQQPNNINENQINEIQQSSTYDQLALQTLKQQVSLTNHQLLQLTYNDQKFYQKLKQLNHYGCVYIKRMQFQQALVYLSEAEKVLEYAASCGKTIQRKLIIATLNNQASLYQKAWQLQKAQSYLQAIIYNISSFFQSNTNNNISQQQYQSKQQLKSLTKLQQQFSKNILNQQSPQYQDYSIALWRKKSLVIFYLQYCAINSQNKNNQRAFKSAQKALSLIKQVCLDLYKYQKYLRQNQCINKQQLQNQESHHNKQKNSNNILCQLASFKQLNLKQTHYQQTFYSYYKTAVKFIAIYIKRLQRQSSLQSKSSLSQQQMQTYKQCFQNYSIGTIMQINPSQIDQQIDRLNLKQQITIIQKHFKAIYLSVGHFILGTQARFIASQKYTLDETQRRQSPQFQQSQIYHLCSIIILTKFLICESGYFDHIVNSFRNHYKVDLMQQARQYLQRNPQLGQEDEEQQQDIDVLNLFGRQQEQMISPKKHVQNSHNQYQQQQCTMQQVQEIEKLQSQIQTVNQIPGEAGEFENDGPMLNLNTQDSHQYDESNKGIKVKYSGATKSTKLSKNTISTHTSKKQQKHQHDHQNQKLGKQYHMTATKKVQHKKSVNLININKNPTCHQTHKPLTTIHHEHKQPPKTIHMVTSREKQNKLKPTQLNSNTKASKSKKKSDYQFLSSHKKIYSSRQKITQNIKERQQTKRQTIYSKRQSDYVPAKISRSKSKNMRIPTSTQADKKVMRRKDSYGDLRKTKKVEQEYGVASGSTSNKYLLDINKLEIKTSRNNLNINANANDNNMKKSKNRKQSEQKVIKFTSPDLKMKKLKSPRNIKK